MSGSRTWRLNCCLRSKLHAAIPGRIGARPKPSDDRFTSCRLKSWQAFNVDEPYVVKHVSDAAGIRFPIHRGITDGIFFWPAHKTVNLEPRQGLIGERPCLQGPGLDQECATCHPRNLFYPKKRVLSVVEQSEEHDQIECAHDAWIHS